MNRPSLREREGPSGLRRLEAWAGRSHGEERRTEEVRVKLEDSLAVGDHEDAVAKPHPWRRDELAAGSEAAEASNIADELDSERGLLPGGHVGRPCPGIHAEALHHPRHRLRVRRRIEPEGHGAQLRRQVRARLERPSPRVRQARAPRRHDACLQPDVDVGGLLRKGGHRRHPVRETRMTALGEPRQRIHRRRHDATRIGAQHAPGCSEKLAPRRLQLGHARARTEDAPRHELQCRIEERADDRVHHGRIASMGRAHDGIQGAERHQEGRRVDRRGELRRGDARVVRVPAPRERLGEGPCHRAGYGFHRSQRR